LLEDDSRSRATNSTLPRGLFDHIDLRVRNRARAQKFFAKVLPAIGFALDKSAEEWGAFEKDGAGKPSEFFGFTENANHRPNDTRIAFWAETREQVDRVAQVVREAGGRNLEGPQIWPEYSPGYYAFFFEDPDGNKLEICCRGSVVVAD
jgi:catechol 2,3-dioxygenase-like lactoylglutathione lyase family enzyme